MLGNIVPYHNQPRLVELRYCSHLNRMGARPGPDPRYTMGVTRGSCSNLLVVQSCLL